MTSSFDGRWHPGIGDPTPIGWLTAIAYGVAALLCFRCQLRATPGTSKQFWLFVGLIMTMLSINKQLDLQTWFTEVARDMALEQGWYARRRVVQTMFIASMLFGAVFARAWLVQLLRHSDRYAKRASFGLLLLMLFVVVRAASFHHIDRLLGMSLQGMSFNAVLELSGIALITIAAAGCLRSYKRQSGTRR